MSENYQPIETPLSSTDPSVIPPLVHNQQQEYDHQAALQPTPAPPPQQELQQEIPIEQQQQQHHAQQNSYVQYHQIPPQHHQQQMQQPVPQQQQVPQQHQYIVYQNQQQPQQQNHYQVLVPQQQQAMVPPEQHQQRMVMHPQQHPQQQQHYPHPVVVQQQQQQQQHHQQHMINHQQHVQPPPHQMNVQHQVMQQHPQRQILVQHQQQYPHHPQQHQMVQHQQQQQQQQYIMVQQQQQHGVQHLRLQQHLPSHDPNNPIRRAIPIKFNRPAGPQQYPPQQHQYPSQPQQMAQQQQVQQQPGMPPQQPPGQPKIYVIQGGSALRLSKPNGIQVAFRGPMMVGGAQPRPMMQQPQQPGQVRVPMRPQIRHPVVHQAGQPGQQPRLQIVTHRPPQAVQMYNGQPPPQQQMQWNNQQMVGPRVPGPPHQLQYQQQMQQQPMRMRAPGPQLPPEIVYNVEHVFSENGREVRKMPIKMGNETIWVDCVDQKDVGGGDTQESGIMLDLMDETPLAGPDNEQLGTSGASINRLLPNNMTHNNMQPHKMPNNDMANSVPNSNVQHSIANSIPIVGSKRSKNITDEERDTIVKEVVDDQISPTIVGEKYGISVTHIRNWVRSAGHKLPSKYKVTKEKVVKERPNNPAVFDGGVQGQHLGAEGPGASMPTMGADGLTRLTNQTDQPPSGAQVGDGKKSPAKQQLPLTRGLGGPLQLKAEESGVGAKKVQTPSVLYKPKLIPGKLAVCKNCGGISQDFNRCARCRKPIPEDCKTVPDPSFNKCNDEMSKLGSLQNKGGDLRTVRIQHKPRRKNNTDEPECIALSSDEDDDDEDVDEEGDENSANLDENGEGSRSGINDGTNLANDEREMKILDEIKSLLDGSAEGQFATLTARSIRVGSYKSFSKEKIVFVDKAIRITVPGIFEPQVMTTLTILKSDIVKIQAHFGRAIPALFVFASPVCCAKIRTALKMNKAAGLWLDMSISDESMRRITILPEKIPDDTKSLLLQLYGPMVEEIDGQVANDILVKSSPKDTKLRMMQQQQGQPYQMQTLGGATVSAVKKNGNDVQSQAIEKYCQFPPSGSNPISVTTEDYYCLEDESFLNDVIIDFFFKWLQFDLISPEDRDRTHIFSTFFYNRLTRRPQIQKNKLHPVEDDVNLTAAEKRYARVKRWTKSVDLFKKDFIVVPINEHSHWFVAVICFPGLEGCHDIETHEPCQIPVKQQKAAEAATEKSQKNKARKKELADKKVMQIGSTSIIPLKPGGNMSFLDKMSFGGEESDKDEASASDDDLVDEEELSLLGLQQKAAALIKLNNSTPAGNPAASIASNPATDQQQKTEESSTEMTVKTDDQKTSTDCKSEDSPVDSDPVTSKADGNVEKTESVPTTDNRENSELTTKSETSVGVELSKDDDSKTETENVKTKSDCVDSSQLCAEPAKVDCDDKPTGADVTDPKLVVASINGEAGNDCSRDAPVLNAEAKVETPASNAESSEIPEAKVEEAKGEEPEIKIKVEEETTGDVEIKKEPEPVPEIKIEIKTEIKEEIKEEKPVRVKQPCILIFDSLRSGSRSKVVATLRDYLECEYREKIGKDRVFSKETFRGCCPSVPQQPNFSDCGIFVLQYIESFFKNPITDFCLPITDLKKWFTMDVVRNKRSDIAKTIRELAAKQYPAKKFEFPPIVFTPESGSGYTDEEENSEEDNGGGCFSGLKRNPTLIKVMGGPPANKNSTPTKFPSGIIVTPVGSSTPLNNRVVCVQNSFASQTSQSSSSNVTPKQGSVVFIKKGGKIDLLHGPNGGSPAKKQRVIVPKITKPNLTAGSKAAANKAANNVAKANNIPNNNTEKANNTDKLEKVNNLDKVESPDSATDPDSSTKATSTSTTISKNVEKSGNVDKVEQDNQVSTNSNVTPTKNYVDDNSPSSSSGCKRSIAESSCDNDSKTSASPTNISAAKKAKLEPEQPT